MCRILFTRRFYTCLRLAYIDHAKDIVTVTRTRQVLILSILYCVIFILLPILLTWSIVYCEPIYKLLSACLLFGLFVAFCAIVGCKFKHKVKKRLNEMDSEIPESQAASQHKLVLEEDRPQWYKDFYGKPNLIKFPHSTTPLSDQNDILSSIHQNRERLRQNYERLCAQESPDSAVSEISFLEDEQDSNIHLQVTHRSRHPSRSLEEHAELTHRSPDLLGSGLLNYNHVVRTMVLNKEMFGKNYESLCSQASPDSAVSEVSFLEVEQDNNDGSNLLPQETQSRHPSRSIMEPLELAQRSRHPSRSVMEPSELTQRSRHPSMSSDEQLSTPTTFVVKAEVYRANEDSE